MKQKTHINGLFNRSGCLTTKVMLDYLDQKLNQDQENQVKSHLASCDLCSDAIEGIAGMEDRSSLTETIRSIDRSLLEMVRAKSDKTEKSNAAKSSGRLWYYISAAASVVLLIGFYFILRQSHTRQGQDLAMIGDTLVDESHPSTLGEPAEMFNEDRTLEAIKTMPEETAMVESSYGGMGAIPATAVSGDETDDEQQPPQGIK